MKSSFAMMLAGAAVTLASAADAHVSASANAIANTTQVITFGVGHGCEGADTYGIRVEIPSTVTSVRVLPNAFGRATVQTNAAGAVTSVTWQKADADVAPGDSFYYALQIRARLPDAPFTTVYFPTRQTCRTAGGMTTTVDWVGTSSTPAPDGGAAPEPAPSLTLLPARQPGWNRYTVPAAVSNLATFFGDAQSVWRATSAWSPNANTTALILSTPGVTPLDALRAMDQVWVRY